MAPVVSGQTVGSTEAHDLLDGEDGCDVEAQARERRRGDADVGEVQLAGDGRRPRSEESGLGEREGQRGGRATARVEPFTAGGVKTRREVDGEDGGALTIR